MKENHLNVHSIIMKKCLMKLKLFKNCMKTNYWDEESYTIKYKVYTKSLYGEPPTKFRYNGRTYTSKVS